MTCETFWDEKEKLNKISKVNINLKFCFQWFAMIFLSYWETKGVLQLVDYNKTLSNSKLKDFNGTF